MASGAVRNGLVAYPLTGAIVPGFIPPFWRARPRRRPVCRPFFLDLFENSLAGEDRQPIKEAEMRKHRADRRRADCAVDKCFEAVADQRFEDINRRFDPNPGGRTE